MRLEDFDFELPAGQIAQTPVEPRDAARLLLLPLREGELEHHRFRELPALLAPGDLLVVNDARVIPARLLGTKAGTGGKAELLLVRPAAPDARPHAALEQSPDAFEWICLGQASKGLKPRQRVILAGGLEAEILEARGEGEVRVRFTAGSGSLAELLDRAGGIPLPPYIERPPTARDRERYQTVYARSAGSVAAPTAGLHFTDALFARLEERGVRRVALTLDVGPGTFLPVREAQVEQHRMHEERFTISEATAAAIRQTRAQGGRVVAVGTTVVRALEAVAHEHGELVPYEGTTRLFIRPGFSFQVVDAMVTNFHLPRSTLLMLVAAFAGRERILEAYRTAVQEGYRFFSYGDAMLIRP